VSQGQSATFSVTAAGTAPLAYQWRFNTAPIAGATSSSYTRTNVQSADAGNYSVLVTNQAGSASSSDAVLTVKRAPVHRAPARKPNDISGPKRYVYRECGGERPAQFPMAVQREQSAGETASSFTIASAQSTNHGAYLVVVTNALGTAVSSNALLTIVSLVGWGDNSLGQRACRPRPQTCWRSLRAVGTAWVCARTAGWWPGAMIFTVNATCPRT